MRAVVIGKITVAEEIELTEVPIPKVKSGWVLVKVKAFGLNHSEQILRHQEIKAAYIQKPVIPGIECVGEVVDPGDTRFMKGQKICALMGGMGRSFNGSYTEYALLPKDHVFPSILILHGKLPRQYRKPILPHGALSLSAYS